jgi:hypothetical protein
LFVAVGAQHAVPATRDRYRGFFLDSCFRRNDMTGMADRGVKTPRENADRSRRDVRTWVQPTLQRVEVALDRLWKEH